MESNELTDGIRLPYTPDQSTTRLLVWEKTGRWAAAMRRELGEKAQRPIEIRSSRMLRDELGIRPASFVLIEATPDNAERLPEALALLRQEYHLASFAVACDRLDPECEDFFREAGAVEVIDSAKEMFRITRMFRRFMDQNTKDEKEP